MEAFSIRAAQRSSRASFHSFYIFYKFKMRSTCSCTVTNHFRDPFATTAERFAKRNRMKEISLVVSQAMATARLPFKCNCKQRLYVCTQTHIPKQGPGIYTYHVIVMHSIHVIGWRRTVSDEAVILFYLSSVTNCNVFRDTCATASLRVRV